MKKLFSPIVIFIAIIVIAGCSTKFNIGAPYKNITVIYGFLDEADTAHYIRVQKAFLDQTKNAITMSQTPDSSFYRNIDVRMNRISTTTGNFVDSIPMNRVDLDLEGYPKQQGTFFNSPNYAYKFTNTLNPAYIYRIMVTNLTTGEVDSADAPVIEDLNHGVFYVDQLDDVIQNLNGMDFATTGINDQFFSVGGSYNYTAVGNGQTDPVSIVEAVITFNWYDSDIIAKTLTPRSYAYNLGYMSYNSTNGIDFMPLDNTLYSAIYTGMGVAPQHIYRLMDRCDITVYASTNDFSLYQQAQATVGTGLTGSDIEPIFTNIKGANALGLYTSRGSRTGKITMTSETIDSLVASPFLKPVNIAGTIY